MFEVKQVHIVIYRLIDSISHFDSSAATPSASFISGFLSGADKSPDVKFYQTNAKYYGVWPKANKVMVMMRCRELIEEGYLKKQAVGNEVHYSLTTKILHQADKKFLDLLPAKKARLAKRVIKFVKNYAPDLILNHNSNYYGFQYPKNNATKNIDSDVNWMWISNQKASAEMLTLKIRPTPKSRVPEYYDYDENSLDYIEGVIKEYIGESKEIYGMAVNDFATMKIVEAPRQGQIVEDKSILFNDFLSAGSEIKIAGDDGSISALLSIVDASPFNYTASTVYEPLQASLLTKNKSNFDYGPKWKLLAWTTSTQKKSLVRDALLVSKTNKDIWIIICLTSKKVLCVSRTPVDVKKDDVQYKNTDLLKLAFK